MKKITYTILVLGFTVFLAACGKEKSVEPVLTPTPVVSTATATPQPTAKTTPTVSPTSTPVPIVTNTPIPTVTPEPTATPLPTATPTPKPSVTLTMAGDILLHTKIHTYSKQADGSYNYDAVFAHLTDEI